jgi:indole-3-acetate monooxygenase
VILKQRVDPQEKAMHWDANASLIDAARDIAPTIQKHNEEAERERRLSRPVLAALRETGLLRMFTPRSLGGLETDPITRALVVEEISRHDSAAGWTLKNPLDWVFFVRVSPMREQRRSIAMARTS